MGIIVYLDIAPEEIDAASAAKIILMGSIYTYGFLLDRCVEGLLADFPAGRTRTIRNLGLAETASDREIVKRSVEESLIIVTANNADFISEIERYRLTSSSTECHEANGLVTVPGDLRELDYRAVTEDLRMGGHKITWQDVSDDNLRVNITRNMRATVVPMKRCQYCLRASK